MKFWLWLWLCCPQALRGLTTLPLEGAAVTCKPLPPLSPLSTLTQTEEKPEDVHHRSSLLVHPDVAGSHQALHQVRAPLLPHFTSSTVEPNNTMTRDTCCSLTLLAHIVDVAPCGIYWYCHGLCALQTMFVFFVHFTFHFLHYSIAAVMMHVSSPVRLTKDFYSIIFSSALSCSELSI